MKAALDVLVVGAGISGLATAWYLRESGKSVRLVEASGRAGGNINTFVEDGFLWEAGPNTLHIKDRRLLSLVRELGLEPEMVYANTQVRRRYLVKGGRLHALPRSRSSVLSFRGLSVLGKLTVLKDLIAPYRLDDDATIDQVVRGRLGAEVADYLVDPFVRGIFAGDPRELIFKAAFPKLHRLLQEKHSLILAALGAKRSWDSGLRETGAETDHPAPAYSFRRGLAALPGAIADKLADSISYNVRVHKIEQVPGGGFSVTFGENGTAERLLVKQIVLAVGAGEAGRMLDSIDSRRAQLLAAINYPPLAVAFTGFKADAVGHPLDGFGFLSPSCEKQALLGSLWNSTIFGGRAPEGYVALTAMVGGRMDVQGALAPEAALIERVLDSYRVLLDIKAPPTFIKLLRFDRSIPQYTKLQPELVRELGQLETEIPGLQVIGNFRGGVGIGACVEQAFRTAAVVRQRAELSVRDLANSPHAETSPASAP